MANDVIIDYTSKDYDGFRSSLLDYASRIFPEWTSRSEGDFGMLMVEMFSYLGDILSYYGDRIAQEAYLGTASQRSSLLGIAELLGYTPSNGLPATGTVTFVTSNPGVAKLVPAGTQVATEFITTLDSVVTYETDEDVTVGANGATVTVGVTQGITKSMVQIGTSFGVPEQSFRLPNMPIIDGSVRLFVEDATGTTEWTEIAHLIDATPSEQVFATRTDDIGATWVLLGDNVSGRIPSTGLNIYATYRVGGGEFGNVAAGSVRSIVSSSLTGVSIHRIENVYQSSEMSGGADAESNESIRRNAPRAFRTQQRLVTLQDFADAALATPGVSRAKALANHYTSVTVYVTGPGGAQPTTTLKNSVYEALTARSLAGVSVTIAGPEVIKVNFGVASGNQQVKVEVAPRFSRTTVTNEVKKALQRVLSVTRTDFGMRLTLADVYAELKTVPGLQYVSIPMFARADASQSGSADIQFRDWEIPAVGNIVLTVTGGVN